MKVQKTYVCTFIEITASKARTLIDIEDSHNIP